MIIIRRDLQDKVKLYLRSLYDVLYGTIEIRAF